MKIPISLDLLCPGMTARIVSLHHEPAMTRRLADIGFATDELVEPLFHSAAGDPTAYWIRGTVVALRQSDARRIIVIPESEDTPP